VVVRRRRWPRTPVANVTEIGGWPQAGPVVDDVIDENDVETNAVATIERRGYLPPRRRGEQ
jgi:hypothetical protein